MGWEVIVEKVWGEIGGGKNMIKIYCAKKVFQFKKLHEIFAPLLGSFCSQLIHMWEPIVTLFPS